MINIHSKTSLIRIYLNRKFACRTNTDWIVINGITLHNPFSSLIRKCVSGRFYGKTIVRINGVSVCNGYGIECLLWTQEVIKWQQKLSGNHVPSPPQYCVLHRDRHRSLMHVSVCDGEDEYWCRCRLGRRMFDSPSSLSLPPLFYHTCFPQHDQWYRANNLDIYPEVVWGIARTSVDDFLSNLE